ncbi:hypothetical protein BDA96_02G033700 [Sorghum bicolor]|uniref:Uncharacterized protein n=2 Tax=Sorghum bicolor TaxID=4558 RepID=A0A921URF1_SORBI|nr:hypothetical protein SORBI_3002G033550 [Sorghum bicolor]KAG0541633.1 hypothetical protein BDA96_02G033700 [Sorghum bicolor]
MRPNAIYQIFHQLYSPSWAAVVSPHRATTSLSVCTLRRCISIAVICASTTVLRNPCCTIRLHKVFVLLIGSSSSSCHYPRRR